MSLFQEKRTGEDRRATEGEAEARRVERRSGERRQIERVSAGLARHSYVLPWLTEPPVGVAALTRLLSR